MAEDIYSQKPWLKNYDKNVPATLQYEEKTFAEKWYETVQKYGEKTALIYMDNKLTYNQLDRLSNQLAAYLKSAGIKPGDVVGLCMPNVPAHYLSVIAVQKAGAVSTGLSPLLMPEEMEYQINDCQVKVIITIDVLFEKIREVADKCDFSTVIVTEIADFLPGIKEKLAKAYLRQTGLGKLLKKVKKLDEQLKKIPAAPISELKGKKVVRFMDAIKDMPADRVHEKRSMDDTIFIMYTGGTTGPSKGAVLTQRSYMANRLQVLTYLDSQARRHGHLGLPPLPHRRPGHSAVSASPGGPPRSAVPNPARPTSSSRCEKHTSPTSWSTCPPSSSS
jgi:long-chain acyl-CoA synthetase